MSFLRFRRKFVLGTADPSRGNLLLQPRSVTVNGTTGGSSGDNLFVANFTNPQPSGQASQNGYNFAVRHAFSNFGEQQDGQTNWTISHQATGGPNGRPCARITLLPGRYQYGFGWDTPSIGSTWVQGSSTQGRMYVRLLLRLANANRWESDNAFKFIDIGSGLGRTIIYVRGPYNLSSGGGSLGWPVTPNTRVVPSWFGLPGSSNNSWDSEPLYGDYGSFSISQGVGFKAAWPALISYGNNASAPAPGPNSTAPTATDGWYWAQFELASGTLNNWTYTVWVNNDDYTNPTAVHGIYNEGAETQGLAVTGWTGAIRVGGYCDGGTGSHNLANFTYDMAAFEVGRAFRNDWFSNG